jgi:YegS/Rv2252/BmrU family lipid kinase
MKFALFVNLRPNGRRIGPAVRAFTERLNGFGIKTEVFATRHLSELPGELCRLRPGRFDGIVCAGGDGTHYHVLNGLICRSGLSSLPPMGIVPLGRGNSFARDLNLISAEDAAAALAQGRSRPVDLCRFRCNGSESFFANLMGVGFVTDVAAVAARYPRAGDLSYVIGVFSRLLALRPARFDLNIDGRDWSGRYCFVEVCNSRYTGGRMLMAPGARIDDSQFDAVLAGPMTSLELIRAFPLIYRGTHVKHPAVRVVRGKRARIGGHAPLGLLPDGELIGTTPVDIQVMPRCVRYFTR